jgi:hypothetical protein
MRIDRPRQAAAEMLGSLGRSVLLSPGGSLPLPLLGDPDADILAALRDTYCSCFITYVLTAICALAAASFFSFASLNARVWWIHTTFIGRPL